MATSRKSSGLTSYYLNASVGQAVPASSPVKSKFTKGDVVMWGESRCVVVGVWGDGTYELEEDGVLVDQHAPEDEITLENA